MTPIRSENGVDYSLAYMSEVLGAIREGTIVAREPPQNLIESRPFVGFTFLRPRTWGTQSPRSWMITAVKGQGLVGVMGLIVHDDAHRYIFDIDTVDVHSGYRRQGVARNLYRTLNGIVGGEDIVIGSPLEQEGKDARLDVVRRSEITRGRVFDTREEYARTATSAEDDVIGRRLDAFFGRLATQRL